MAQQTLIIVLLIFTAYFAIIYTLYKKKVLEKYSMGLFGPFLMWKTQKGKALIERIAKKERFWKVFGTISIALCVFFMVGMTLLLLWEATIVAQIPADKVKPEYALGLPGINPLIPIWYGILGLAVAIIVHEFSHGILARVADIKVKSLGLLFFILPIGAFVEPDEEELAKLSKPKRARMFAVGPASNIFLAIICAMIFSLAFIGSVSPVKEDGAGVIKVWDDTPAEQAGLKPGMIILSINDTAVDNVGDFFDAMNLTKAGQRVNITLYQKGEGRVTMQVELAYNSAYNELNRGKEWYTAEKGFLGIDVRDSIEGLEIESIISKSPAERAGLESGMLITSINGTEVKNSTAFYSLMNSTHAGQEIELIANNKTFTILLGVNKGYLGVTPFLYNHTLFIEVLQRPYAKVSNFLEFFGNTLFYVGLPFFALSPFQSPVTDFYKVEGPLAVLPEGLFWVLANAFYWIFWLNLMVGIFNALPMVPLDGGYIFKDGIDSFITRVRKRLSSDVREKYVNAITYTFALFILFLIAWQLIGPRVVTGL